MHGAEIMKEVDELVAKRKNGGISDRDFYFSLLDILSKLIEALKSEKSISDSDIRTQTPLILSFIYDQADKLEKRS